jgi:hypothetical protein
VFSAKPDYIKSVPIAPSLVLPGFVYLADWIKQPLWRQTRDTTLPRKLLTPVRYELARSGLSSSAINYLEHAPNRALNTLEHR